MAKITIDGLAGTGKSTAARGLADKLGYQHYSNGDFCRAQAEAHGLSLHDFDELAKSKPEFDLERDKMVEDFGKSHQDIIIDGRLGWRFIPDAFKVKLYCDFDERVRRAAKREGKDFELAKKETLMREEAIADRFLRYYGIEDASADSHYDLIIDTTNTAVGEAVDIIYRALKAR